MATKRLHLQFPKGAPLWARWGRRVRIGDNHYRVGRANDQEAILWLESRPEVEAVVEKAAREIQS